MNVIEASGLARNYRRTHALADCDLAVPQGCVAALVGPNGAGKTTLLHLLAGILPPTRGTVAVVGGARPGSVAARSLVALVSQDSPVYRGMSVRDVLCAARGLNARWDHQYAETRLASLGIPVRRRVSRLSGGQRAQLALTLALARHPDLLLLDEPLAALDPLARHDVLATLVTTVHEEKISVVFSSHVLGDLENVANYLILLGQGSVLLSGPIDEILGAHRILTGRPEDLEDLSAVTVVSSTRAARQVHVLARCQDTPPGWQAREVDLEELVLAYLRAGTATGNPAPDSTGKFLDGVAK